MPDWSVRYEPYEDLVPGNDNAKEYAQSGGPSTNISITVSGNELVVSGYIIDAIENTGTVSIASSSLVQTTTLNPKMDRGSPIHVEGLLECIMEASRLSSRAERYHTCEAKEEVMWRTLICNREVGSGHEAPNTYRLKFAALLAMLSLAPASGNGDKDILRNLHQNKSITEDPLV